MSAVVDELQPLVPEQELRKFLARHAVARKEAAVQSVDALFDHGALLISWMASAHISSFRVLFRSATQISVQLSWPSFTTWCYAGEGHAVRGRPAASRPGR